jgi:O-antigen/teichoic acid export membrane protein
VSAIRDAAAFARIRRAAAVLRLAPFDDSTVAGRSRERYRRIALTTASGFATRIVAMAVNLVTVPIALGYLGRAQYGLWAAVTSFTTWVVLFDLGIVNGLVNAIAQANGADDREGARRAVSTAFALLVGIAAALGLAAAIALPLIDWAALFAARGAVDATTVRWAVAAAVIPVIVALPLSIVRQIYAGYQRAYVGNLFSLLGSAGTLAGTLLAARLDAGLPALVAVVACSTTIAGVLNMAYLFRVQMPWLRPRWSLASRESALRLLRVSVPLFLFQAGALLVSETQLIILAHRAGLALAGDYSLVLRLYVLIGSVIVLSTSAFVPAFREAAERGEHAWLRRGFTRMLVARMAMAGIAAGTVLLAGNLLLRLWLGRAAVQFDLSVWALLAVLVLAAPWATAFSDLLTIMDRVWAQVGLVLANGAATAYLTYLLAPAYGVAGALAAMTCVTAVISSWLLPVLTRPLLAPHAPVPALHIDSRA